LGQAVSRRRAITIAWRLIDDVIASKKQRLVDKREKRPDGQFLVQREIEELLRDLAAFNERIAELEKAEPRDESLKDKSSRFRISDRRAFAAY
jgi:flagellar motility protein MotE (MotC chaperone)